VIASFFSLSVCWRESEEVFALETTASVEVSSGEEEEESLSFSQSSTRKSTFPPPSWPETREEAHFPLEFIRLIRRAT